MQSTKAGFGDDEASASVAFGSLEGGVAEIHSTVPQYECPQLNEACFLAEPATPPLPALERVVARRCRVTVAHAPSGDEATRRSIEQVATPQHAWASPTSTLAEPPQPVTPPMPTPPVPPLPACDPITDSTASMTSPAFGPVRSQTAPLSTRHSVSEVPSRPVTSFRGSPSPSGLLPPRFQREDKQQNEKDVLESILGGGPTYPSCSGPRSLPDLEFLETGLPTLCRSAHQGRIEEHLKSKCIDIALQAFSVAEAMRSFPRSAKLQRDAAKLLEVLGSKDASMKTEMVSRGALMKTIDALRVLLSLSEHQAALSGTSVVEPVLPDDVLVADACAACFRLLAVICQRHQGHQISVREAGGVDIVLRCLAMLQFRDGRDAAFNGVWLLMALVHKQPESQKLVRTQNGIMLLLQLLDVEVSALEMEAARRPLDATRVVERTAGNLCCYIAGCLATIADSNAANQQALYEVGGIHLLLRTLETCLQSPIVVGNACVAISHIVHRHEPSQHAARSQGAVQCILGALLAYRGHASVQGNVCRAIAMLTEKNAANQQAFLAARIADGDGETSALAMLIQALRRLPGEVQMVTHACWALANLVLSNPEAMDQVRQVHGLEVVVSLLGHLERKEHACEYICRLLTELVRGDSLAAHRNRQEFRALEAKEAIMAMMQHHVQSHGFVLVRARDALQHLAASVHVRRAVVG